MEALNHAQSAGVPIVVAVNKIDAMEVFDFNPETFKTYVAERCPDAPVFMVSAATGIGVSELAGWIGERAREILDFESAF